MISRCPSCAAQVADDATRCPSCHWDFVSFKHIPPAGEAVNPTMAAKGAQPPPPQLPAAKSLPMPPTVDPNSLPKARLKAELPGALSGNPPPPTGSFKIPTFKSPGKADEPDLSAEPMHMRLSPFSEDTEPAKAPLKPARKEEPPKPESKPEPKKPASRPAPSLDDLPRERPAEKAPERPEKKLTPRPVPAAAAPDAVLPETVAIRASDRDAGVPDRLKRRSPGDGQASKEIKKKFSGADPIALISVVALIVAAGAVGVVKLTLRSDVEEGSRPSRSVFSGASALGGAAPEPPAVQRVAFDPSRPELGAQPVPASAAVAPVDAPAPAAAAVPSHVAARAPAPSPAPAAAPAPAPAPAPKPAPAAAPVHAAPAPSPIPALPAPAVLAEPAKPAKPAEAWVFEGQIYDGRSLRPVAFAQLSFVDLAGKVVAEGVTRENGRYKVSLPPGTSPGYGVTLKHLDYRPNFIEDVSPSLKTLSDEERLAVLKVVPAVRPWMGAIEAATKKDLVAIPLEL